MFTDLQIVNEFSSIRHSGKQLQNHSKSQQQRPHSIVNPKSQASQIGFFRAMVNPLRKWFSHYLHPSVSFTGFPVVTNGTDINFHPLSKNRDIWINRSVTSKMDEVPPIPSTIYYMQSESSSITTRQQQQQKRIRVCAAPFPEDWTSSWKSPIASLLPSPSTKHSKTATAAGAANPSHIYMSIDNNSHSFVLCEASSQAKEHPQRILSRCRSDRIGGLCSTG